MYSGCTGGNDIWFYFYFLNSDYPPTYELDYQHIGLTIEENSKLLLEDNASFFNLEFYKVPKGELPNSTNRKLVFTKQLPIALSERIYYEPNNAYIFVPVFTGSNYRHKENMYLFWFQDDSVLNGTLLSGDTFYMAVRFYNTIDGTILTFLNNNKPYTGLTIDEETDIYTKVVIDRTNYTYTIYSGITDTVNCDALSFYATTCAAWFCRSSAMAIIIAIAINDVDAYSNAKSFNKFNAHSNADNNTNANDNSNSDSNTNPIGNANAINNSNSNIDEDNIKNAINNATVTPSLSISSTLSKTPSLSISSTLSVTPSLSISVTPSLSISSTPSLSISATPSKTPSRTPSVTPCIGTDNPYLTGLTACWNMEDASNPILDSTSNYNLTGNDVDFHQAGKIGNYSIGFNNYDSVATGMTGLNLTTFTLSIWFNMIQSSETGTRFLMSYWQSTGETPLNGFCINVTDYTFYQYTHVSMSLSFYINGSYYSISTINNSTIYDNNWHHYVLTFNNDTKQVIHYLDNISIFTTTSPVSLTYSGDGIMNLGGRILSRCQVLLNLHLWVG